MKRISEFPELKKAVFEQYLKRYNPKELDKSQTQLNETVYIVNEVISRYFVTDGQLYLFSEKIIEEFNRIRPLPNITFFPYIQYTMYKGSSIRVDELHTDIGGHEGKGYATVLVDFLIDDALNNGNGYNNDTIIYGPLSEIDARTIEAQKRRNQFYYKRGFIVRPNINAVEGSIISTIGLLRTFRELTNDEKKTVRILLDKLYESIVQLNLSNSVSVSDFEEGVFSQLFDTTIKECCSELQENHDSIFSDQSKYHAIKRAIAGATYHIIFDT